MKTKLLTDKQKMFCKEYLVDFNATRAAISAGYSPKTAKEIGSQNLTKPAIKEYIDKMMDKRSKKIEITADYVLEGIMKVTEKCASEGDFNASSALKGFELLGKHKKLFTDVQETKHSFTKMGSVTAVVGKDEKGNDKVEEIKFDIGSDPDDVVKDE